MDGSLPVREVMTREFVGVSEGDDARSTAELLLSEDARCAVVLRGSEPVGIVDDTTLLGAFVEGRPDAPVSEVMIPDVPATSPHTEIEVAADLLVDTRWLVVTDNDSLVGLLTERDVLRVPSSGPGGPEGRDDVPGTPAEGSDVEAVSDGSEQGICEGCGALTRSLAPRNGQMLCPDCREM